MKILSSKGLELAALLMILLMAAYLRFENLAANPAWYTDEATHVEIAKNILHGESRYFAVGDSYLLFARLPLFEYSLALVFKIFGLGMLSLRGFTARLGLLSVLLLYLIMRDLSKNKWLSLLVASAYAFMPQAILYNRFGFSYNLLSPLILLSLWGAVRYQKTGIGRYLALLSLCIGLGTISEFLIWSFLPLILLLGKNWRDRVWALILALVPLGIFCAWQIATVPEAFLFDLGYSLGRTGGGSILEQARRLGENLSILLTDAWWLMGLIGIFLLRDAIIRKTALIFLLPLLFIARTVPLYSLSAYYTMPFFPILALGIGAFFYYGLQFAWERLREIFWRIVALAVLILLIGLPLFTLELQELRKVQTAYPTAIDAFLLNPNDIQAVVDYIEANTAPESLVITSAAVGAILERPSVDFQMAVVALGADAIHIPHDLAPERFVYSGDFHAATYVVVDNLWRNWGAVHMPALVEILGAVETWEIVFESGAIQVYENPER